MSENKDKPPGVSPPRTTTTPGLGTPAARVTPIGAPALRVTPPGTPTERVKRAQSATSRDTAGMAARAERARTAPPATPEIVGEEITGQYEGDELEAARSRRSPEDRFRILETKHDKLDFKVEKLDARVENLDEKVEINTTKLNEVDAKVDRVEVAVSKLDGKMDLLPKMFENLSGELAQRREDGHMVLKQTLELDAHEAKARIDGQKVAKESKWKMAVAIVTGVFSAGVLGALIALAAKGC